MRKRYTAAFKAQVVQEILKEGKTIVQLASEYRVHPSQLNTWKTIGLNGLPSLFSREHKAADADQAAHEKKLNDLYAEIGRLTTQVAWLKKRIWHRVGREIVAWLSWNETAQTYRS
jgi:transposase-like protein